MDHLGGILQYVINLSIGEGKSKMYHALISTEKNILSALNNCRVVALTFHTIKVLERLLLVHLSKQQDPLQFAYHSGVGLLIAFLTLLNKDSLALQIDMQ